MKHKKLIFGLAVFTALGTTLYWLLVFTGVFPLIEYVPGYKTWFWSFPLADAWIVATSTLLAVALKRNSLKTAAIFGFLTSSAMIFLALNGLLFGINTGMIFMLILDEIIEICIKIYCLVVGVFFITSFSKIITLTKE